MEILLAGLLALGSAFAVPQAAATTTDNCYTSRSHTYCTSQTPRVCKTVTGADGRTRTVCLSQKPKTCKTVTAGWGRTRTVCLSQAPRS